MLPPAGLKRGLATSASNVRPTFTSTAINFPIESEVEELFPIPSPPRLGAPGIRDLPVATRPREGNDIDLPLA